MARRPDLVTAIPRISWYFPIEATDCDEGESLDFGTLELIRCHTTSQSQLKNTF